MTTLFKLPVLMLDLCLHDISTNSKLHCKSLHMSTSSTEHEITPSKICHKIASINLNPV